MRSGDAPVSNTLPLLCALGRHKTDGLARWNAGYYFARCTRCRRDLVRTAFTRWQIPKGFRVVWQDESGSTTPAPEPSRQPAPQGQVEFPIREDARFVDAGPVLAEPAEAGPEPVMAEAEHNETARLSAAEVPLAEILRSVPGLADEAHTQIDAPAGEGDLSAEDRFEEQDVQFDGDAERFEEDDVRFAPSDRLIDFVSAEQAEAEASVAEPEAREQTIPEVVDEPAPAPPVESKYPVVPDFMDESSGGIGWDAVSGRIVPRVEPAVTPTEATRDVPTGLLSKSWQELVSRRAQGAGNPGRGWLGGLRASKPKAAVVAQPHGADDADRLREDEIEHPCADETAQPVAVDPEPPVTVADTTPVSLGDYRRSAAVSERPGRFGHFLMNQGAIVAAAIFGSLVLAASVIESRNRPSRVVYGAAPAADTPAAAAPSVAEPRAPVPRSVFAAPRAAFVTASFLNCRSTPSNDADTLRKLERGAPVRVLGTNPGWSSIAHQGRQCWVATQHLSATRPT